MPEPPETERDLSKTTLRRIEQYKDRWTSYGAHTGIVSISERLSAAELRELEIFSGYDDKFLETIGSDVSVAIWKKGSVLFEQGSYLDLAFFVVEGEVEVSVEGLDGTSGAPQPIFDLSRTVVGEAGATVAMPARDPQPAPKARASGREITFLASMDFDLPRGTAARLGPGELFGEIGALSGWPQSVTARAATNCRLVQIRINALRLMKRKSKALKERIDAVYRERALFAQLKSTPLLSDCNDMFVGALKEAVELVSCEPDEVIVRQGEPSADLLLVRSGFVKLMQRFGEKDLVVTYLSKGMTLGEVEILVDDLGGVCQATAVSVEYAELVRIPGEAVRRLLRMYPSVEERLWTTAVARIREAGHSRKNVGHSEFTQVALDTGLVQGNSILVIDLESCTRCDDCVRACEATHGGRPRFVREGDKYGNLLIARSCYHCRDPVCLIGCPTGAIHRAGIGEVVEIADEICIGCSSCANHCPYDAIVMHATGETWPADMVPTGLRGKDRDVASKCDLCHETRHGPACVSNCPQGCAYRVGSLEEFEALLGGRA